MLRTGQSLAPRTGTLLLRFDKRDLSRRREPRYRGPWCLPGPDLHRLADDSLSLGYTIWHSFSSGTRAAGCTTTPVKLQTRACRAGSSASSAVGPRGARVPAANPGSAGPDHPLVHRILTAGFVPAVAYIIGTNASASPQTIINGVANPGAHVGVVNQLTPSSQLHLAVPWGLLAIVVIGLPIAAALLAGALSRSRLPITGARPRPVP
jgi:hypothetical protein